MNILIIGMGSIALKHIAVIKQLEPQANIFALRSSASSKKYDQVYDIYSLDELKITPDFVIISNPTSLHEMAILQSMRFNSPLFIEKPVMAGLGNAEKIQREILQRKLLTYVACNMRFHPAVIFIREFLQNNSPVINEVNIYCGAYLPDWRPGTDFRKVYSAQAEMGGGVHLDLIHELDYCIWLFGTPIGVQSTKTSTSSLQISSVDSARFVLMYPGFTAGITLNYFRRDPKRSMEIITGDGTIEIDFNANRITDKLSGKVLFEEPFNMMDTYHAQMKYFFASISKAAQPMNSFEEGINTLRIALYE